MNGHVGFLAGVTYHRYTALTSPKKGKTAVRCCGPALSVLVMLVSRNAFSRIISLAVYRLSLYIFFLADQISCRSYVRSVYRVWSLAVFGFILVGAGI